jgi:hypothetical protein
MRYESTQHNISWFRDRSDEGTLRIKPPYQRRPVWTIRQKSHLVETILLRFPIPEIYVHVEIDEQGKSRYAVVDGQQRIRTILQFVGAKTDDLDEGDIGFSLGHLEPNDEFFDMAFNDLTAEQRREFFAYTLAVREIHDARDADVRSIFTRLNKFLTKLNPQELRNAVYSGPFVRLACTLADDEFWTENRILTPAVIRRMGDIEFVSELLIGVLDGPQSGKADVIDDYYYRFEEYDDEFPEQGEIRRRFGKTLLLIQKVLPDIRETRWKNRTDFYSLFVACAHKLRKQVLIDTEQALKEFRRRLDDFAGQVASAISAEGVDFESHVRRYADAHQKGSNEKSRRAARHEALLSVLDPCFKERRTASASR